MSDTHHPNSAEDATGEETSAKAQPGGMYVYGRDQDADRLRVAGWDKFHKAIAVGARMETLREIMYEHGIWGRPQ